MSKRFSITIIMTAAMALLSMAAGPYLVLVPDDVVDFGQFDAKNIQSKQIFVKNTGDEPLLILKAFRGCSCTSIDYPHEPIEPGDSAAVTVSLDARNRIPGPIRKSIRLTSNANNRYMSIFIRGEIPKPNPLK